MAEGVGNLLYRETCNNSSDLEVPQQKTWATMNSCERAKEIFLTPIQFILGLIQCIGVLFILFVGLFLKGGAKGLFIDQCILGSRHATAENLEKAADGSNDLCRTETIKSSVVNGDLKAYIIERKQTAPLTTDQQTEDLPLSSHEDWVVFIPGMQSSFHTHHRETLSLFNATGAAGAICVNPPGIGLSEGKTNGPNDFFSGPATAIEWIKQNHKIKTNKLPLRITLWGHSLGGAAAIGVANKEEFEQIPIRVVLDRTFTSYDQAIQYNKLIFNPCALLLRAVIKSLFSLDSKTEIERTKREIIVVFAPRDEVIRQKASAARLNSKNITKKLSVEFIEHSRTPGQVNDEIPKLSSTPQHSLGHTIDVIMNVWNSFTTQFVYTNPDDGDALDE